jgi:glutamyl-tRNA synthetase
MIRTRFAPSPTGMIHIGNIRTALYAYLIAKHNNGQFILRIEDTDKERSNDIYIQKIYDALKILNLHVDESPNKPNDKYIPYIQSERVKSGIYMKYALQLIEQGDAYYCFCPEAKTDLDTFKEECNYKIGLGYNGHCRNLSKDEIEKSLQEGKPFVIRQKMPENKIITYYDEVYGDITFNSNDLDDQVLIKQDGYPTYNFANVIDDHLMDITHVVRGNEYLSSTPKYILLYNAFKWSVPCFIHLPLIYIFDSEGKEQKLSKRFNCASFESLIEEGYLSDAIINYIVKLGWGTSDNQEIFSLQELIEKFDFKNINKTHKVIFDKDKLDWMNHKYIVDLNINDFTEYCKKYCNYNIDWNKVYILIKDKIKKFNELNYELSILKETDVFKKSLLFDYKKKDYNENDIIEFCKYLCHIITDDMKSIDYENIIREYSKSSGINFGSLMYIYRIIITGRKIIIMSATDVSELIGKNEVIKRINDFLKI